jgi:hypothetical protein
MPRIERLSGADGLVKGNGPLQHLPMLDPSIDTPLPGHSQ